MTIEELKNIRQLVIQVETIKKTINSLEIDADIHASHFGDNTASSNYKHSYVEGRITKHFQSYDELCERYQEKMEELAEEKAKACKIIMMIESEPQRIILLERYINGLMWKDIADKYHYCDEPYDLHNRALKSFENCQK